MSIPSVPVDIKSPIVAIEHHLRPVHLWAAGIKTPLRHLDGDGRLEEGERNTDQLYGQNNWHVALEFKDFAHLADLLGGGAFNLPSFVCGNTTFDCGPIEENQIARLAICAHGAPGAIDMDGIAGKDLMSGDTDPTLMNEMTLSRYLADFAKIERVLQPRSKVFFVSCITGADVVGENFLKAISLVWAAKEIMVFGFRSVLYAGPGKAQERLTLTSTSSCYPGVRETHYSNLKMGGAPRYYEVMSSWNDLVVLPWASEHTPHAVMAYKGFILKQGASAVFGWSPDGGPWVDPPFAVPGTP
jgi:hypothetical protein